VSAELLPYLQSVQKLSGIDQRQSTLRSFCCLHGLSKAKIEDVAECCTPALSIVLEHSTRDVLCRGLRRPQELIF
jgi:hypothetical protein